MAAKGAQAKEYVVKKLKDAFGDDYIGEIDKKYYVWSQENGAKIQIAIAMTCPKTPVNDTPKSPTEFNWDEASDHTNSAPKFEPAQITDSERARVAELMEKLGL